MHRNVVTHVIVSISIRRLGRSALKRNDQTVLSLPALRMLGPDNCEAERKSGGRRTSALVFSTCSCLMLYVSQTPLCPAPCEEPCLPSTPDHSNRALVRAKCGPVSQNEAGGTCGQTKSGLASYAPFSERTRAQSCLSAMFHVRKVQAGPSLSRMWDASPRKVRHALQGLAGAY